MGANYWLLAADLLLTLIERGPLIIQRYQDVIDDIRRMQAEGRNPTPEEWAELKAVRERLTAEIMSD